MINMHKTGARISGLRKEHGMTQAELAAKLLMTPQAVSKWETGQALPDYGQLVAMSRLFQTSINNILTGEDYRVPVPELTDAVTHEPNPEPEREDEDDSSSSRKIDLQTVADLAPFVDRATLAQMVEGCDLTAATPSQLAAIAPFLETDALDRCATRLASFQVTDLQALAPFLSSAGLAVLMDRVEGDLTPAQLAELAPFLTSEACSKVFIRLLNDPKEAQFRDFARLTPFVTSEALQALANTLHPRSYEELRQVAPFLDKGTVSRMAQRLATRG
jgi:transcriptional regulator with XRE-family HTH domain